jgi:hypothetical protein
MLMLAGNDDQLQSSRPSQEWNRLRIRSFVLEFQLQTTLCVAQLRSRLIDHPQPRDEISNSFSSNLKKHLTILGLP